MNQSENNIGIIGFGRFGRLLAKILSADYNVLAYDPHSVSEEQHNIIFTELNDVLEKTNTLFIAVPIRSFETTIQTIAPLLTTPCTIIDVCSVKMFPVKIMQQYLPAHVNIIATHPLFGPDSFYSGNHCKMMMHNVRTTAPAIIPTYQTWQDYFIAKNIEILEMTPEQHDQLIAKSQNITHFTARVLECIDIHSTPVDTMGFQRLLKIMEQCCNDSWELFFDLHRYNPYAQQAIEQFVTASNEIYQKLFTDTQTMQDKINLEKK